METKIGADLTAFLEKIQSPDDRIRVTAWQSAGPQGAAAIAPLGALAASHDKGTARAATQALETITHAAAKNPRARAAIAEELLKIARSDRPRMVRANAIYLIGFCGESKIVPGLAHLLTDPILREDARLALERIPGSASLNALEHAEKSAPPDFKPNLAQSLHNRSLTRKTVGIRVASR